MIKNINHVKQINFGFNKSERYTNIKVDINNMVCCILGIPVHHIIKF